MVTAVKNSMEEQIVGFVSQHCVRRKAPEKIPLYPPITSLFIKLFQTACQITANIILWLRKTQKEVFYKQTSPFSDQYFHNAAPGPVRNTLQIEMLLLRRT